MSPCNIARMTPTILQFSDRSLNRNRPEAFLFNTRYRIEMLNLKKLQEHLRKDLKDGVAICLPVEMREIHQYVRWVEVGFRFASPAHWRADPQCALFCAASRALS